MQKLLGVGLTYLLMAVIAWKRGIPVNEYEPYFRDQACYHLLLPHYRMFSAETSPKPVHLNYASYPSEKKLTPCDGLSKSEDLAISPPTNAEHKVEGQCLENNIPFALTTLDDYKQFFVIYNSLRYTRHPYFSQNITTK